MESPPPGQNLIRWSWRSTAVLTVVLAAGVAAPSALAEVVAVASLAMFAVGVVTFLWAYFIALQRSRTEDVSVAGLYLLSEGAPKVVKRHLLGSLTLQTVLAIVAASVRPFTAVAFGLLAPVLGMGLAGLWSARHGTFRPRPPTPPRRRTGKVATGTQTAPAEDATISELTEGDDDAR